MHLAASLDSKYSPIMPRAPEHNRNHNADHDDVGISARPVSMPRTLFTLGLVKKYLLAHDTAVRFHGNESDEGNGIVV